MIIFFIINIFFIMLFFSSQLLIHTPLKVASQKNSKKHGTVGDYTTLRYKLVHKDIMVNSFKRPIFPVSRSSTFASMNIA